MRRRQFSWTVAFCASVAAHVFFIRWRALVYVRENEPIRLAGLDHTLLAVSAAQSVDEVEKLGDSQGSGYATDSSAGEMEELALKADEDQSFLSRDPAGPGQIGSPPSQSTAIPGQNGESGARTAKQALFEPQPPIAPQIPPQASPQQQAFGVQATAAAQKSPQFAKQPPGTSGAGPNPKLIVVADSLSSSPQPSSPSPAQKMTTPMAAQTPSPPRTAATPSPPQAVSLARAGRPGPNTPPADPAPQAETESDPFAIVGSLEFRQGSTSIRMGRKHRITRPRLSWDTQYDFFGMTRSIVVLDLQLDETGQVTSATIERSSGSESIDQPCRIAAYQWWFEPAKDPSGHPIRDEIKFTIKFL